MRTTPKKQATEYVDDSIMPNKYLQPFQHQAWKIIGEQVNSQYGKHEGRKPRPFREFVFRYSKNVGGLVGIFMFLFLVLGAIIIPFTTNDPTVVNQNIKYLQPFSTVDFSDNPFTSTSNDAASLTFIFGADSQGRDIWAMLWYGLRFSLLLALVVTLIDLFVGVTLGVLMGYFDRFDYGMQFAIKVISNVPVIIIMIISTIVFKPSFWVLAISMSITGWIGMANQIRAQIKRGRNFEWVTASKVLGTPSWKIVMNFVPLIIPMIITQLVFTIPGAILSESSLAFIGLSIPNTATLGNMINDGKDLITLYPRYTLIPSSMLVIVVTSVQLVGNATQDALRRQR